MTSSSGPREVLAVTEDAEIDGLPVVIGHSMAARHHRDRPVTTQRGRGVRLKH